ncbi:MAG: DUF3662 domain-containing protein, partial [Actinomycetaceae bacterium]|nr:DUF3662 domain-containing protein [Actinomycetaceae bacterium]
MGAFDKFERGVENAVAGAFAKAFRSDLKPVEIASALKKRMDEEAATLKRGRTVAPNDFVVSLSSSDYANVEDWGTDALSSELVATLTEYATDEDYVLLGPLRIAFHLDNSLKSGNVHVSSSTK